MFGRGFGSGFGGGSNHGLLGGGQGQHHQQHHHEHGHDHDFNRWGSTGTAYTTSPGYNAVDYKSGWNPSSHDQLLHSNIDAVYQRYDQNRSEKLEGNEFFLAYRDLCLMMGLAPPQDSQSFMSAATACDSNHDGRVSKAEMFMLFKHIQGINAGQMY